jgi:hypothetical protein
MEEKQYYSEKRVSNSSLSYFEESPALFKKFIDNEIEQEEKSYFSRGKQIHMAILEPDEFYKNYNYVSFETPKSEQQKQFCADYVKYKAKLKEDEALLSAYKNSYKVKKQDDKITEDAKDLRDKLTSYIEYIDKKDKYKEILSFVEWDKIHSLKSQSKIHKKAKELLYLDPLNTYKTAYNELIIFWEDTLHKVPCKSMIDRLVIDEENKVIQLIDLKTTSTFKGFKDKAREFRYFRQLAFYWIAVGWYLKNVLNKDYSQYKLETYIIALRTTENPEVKVYAISDTLLNEGLVDINALMPLIGWHYETNQWDYPKEYYNNDGVEKL